MIRNGYIENYNELTFKNIQANFCPQKGLL